MRLANLTGIVCHRSVWCVFIGPRLSPRQLVGDRLLLQTASSRLLLACMAILSPGLSTASGKDQAVSISGCVSHEVSITGIQRPVHKPSQATPKQTSCPSIELDSQQQVPPAMRFQLIRVAREAGSGARDRLFMQKELRLLPGNRYFADAEMLLVAFRALGLNRRQ